MKELNASELHVGNWLGIYGVGMYKIEQVDIDIIKNNDVHQLPDDAYHGIEITENILEDCGFILEDGSSPLMWTNSGFGIVKFVTAKGSAFMRVSGIGKKEIRYKVVQFLHELQNEFFNQIKKELVYKSSGVMTVMASIKNGEVEYGQ